MTFAKLLSADHYPCIILLFFMPNWLSYTKYGFFHVTAFAKRKVRTATYSANRFLFYVGKQKRL